MKTNHDFKETDKQASKAFIKKGKIVEHQCGYCWGDGKIDINFDRDEIECPNCEGKGFVSVEY